MEVFPQVLRFPQAFLNKVNSKGVITSTPSSFKRLPGSPKPMPDLSRPQNAYLLSNLRDRTLFRNIVQDGNYKRVNPVELFSAKFPLTCFIHGTEDKMALPRFSKAAYKFLKSFDVNSELLVADS